MYEAVRRPPTLMLYVVTRRLPSRTAIKLVACEPAFCLRARLRCGYMKD